MELWHALVGAGLISGLGLFAGCGNDVTGHKQPEDDATVHNVATTRSSLAAASAPAPESRPAALPPSTQSALASSGPGPTTIPADGKESKTLQGGVVVTDLVVGTGVEAKSGNIVTVNYTGWLTNGTVFDSSQKPGGQPFVFTIGIGAVIKGWDLGVPGMKVGGKRKITIPPAMGYGSSEQGSIPPNSTLVFQVELLGVH